MRRIAALALSIAACDARALPPRPQILVYVDTDVPAPSIAGRVRVDFFHADGGWFDSRTLAVPDPSSWPLSFLLYSKSDASTDRILLRIRIHPDGREREYFGERWEPAPILTGSTTEPGTALPSRAAIGVPRLDRGHGDETPATEPLPRLTMDRLVLFEIGPATHGKAVVVLRGACIGRMARLATTDQTPPDLETARTCIDEARRSMPVVAEPTDPDLAPPASQVGTFGASKPCKTAPNDIACIPGRAFIFGGPRFGDFNVRTTMPDRVVRVSTFYLDKHEVDAAHYRAAVAGGLMPDVELTCGAPQAVNGCACPYGGTPQATDTLPMSCVHWPGARAYCRFKGGDLPTEAQWEAATSGMVGYKPRFPTGDSPPDCTHAVWGRAYPNDTANGPVNRDCGSDGPTPPNDADVSRDGVFSLAGGVSEWTLDDGRPFNHPCWLYASDLDPVCTGGITALRAVRGGSWRSPAAELDILYRDFEATGQGNADWIGFRCAYTEPPP